jgi:DNA-binding NtrC family response regulator
VPTILVVDDSRTIRLAMAQAIRAAWGKDVEILGADDDETAWQTFLGRDVDVVFVDMVMPGETETAVGLELLRDMTEEKPRVPVVVVSALPRDHPILVQALSFGAIATLPKPVRPDDVRRVLEGIRSKDTRFGYIQ